MRRFARTTEAAAVGACLLVATSAFGQQVKYVDVNVAGGANDGTSWANAYANLQEALAGTGSGTNLWIAQGVYTPGTNRNDTFVMTNGVHLYGGFTNGMASLGERDWTEHRTILSGDIGIKGDAGDNSYHILTAATNGIADGLILTGGNADGATAVNRKGAALFCNAPGFTLRNCAVIRNRDTGTHYTESGAVLAMATGLTLDNCLLAENAGYAVVGLQAHNGVLRNCLFLRNSGSNSVATSAQTQEHHQILECTFFGNAGAQLCAPQYATFTVRNCVIWSNATALSGWAKYPPIHVSHSDIEGCGGSGSWRLLSVGALDNGGNIDADPLFAGGPAGTWTAAAAYDTGADLTTLTDAGASFTPGALEGAFLNPDTSGRHAYVITANTDDQIVVWGDASALGGIGNAYRVEDPHLQSTVGRWTAGGFVADSQTSPCVDGGYPGSAYALEPVPNGNRVNMGAYGNTTQASMSLDTHAPGPVAHLSAAPGNAKVFLTWENPPDLDFAGVLVLRKTDGAPSGTPEDGTTYAAGETLGDARVLYAGTGGDGTPAAISGWTNAPVQNGDHYYYMVFAYDAGPRYSGGQGADTTPAAPSPIIYVDASATGANNGSSWANAYTHLAAALGVANNGTKPVWVARGTYYPGTARADAFWMDNVAVYGGFTNGMTSLDQRDWTLYETILSGDIGTLGSTADNSYHIVIWTNTVLLDGFSVAYGNGTYGSAVWDTVADTYPGTDVIPSQNCFLRNCTIRNNIDTGGNQGSVSCRCASLFVSNCVFRTNSKCGISNRYYCRSFVQDSLFAANGQDGIRVCYEKAGTITNCIFAANGQHGVNHYYRGDGLRVVGCLFSGNGKQGYYNLQTYSTGALANSLFAGKGGGWGSGRFVGRR